MNPETELKRICENYNGVFEYEDYKVGGEIGSFVHISKYRLKIFYKNFDIDVLYDFGNSDTAEFKINKLNNNKIPEFEIKTIDHLSKLILFKKRNWNIKSSDILFKENIAYLITKLNLNELIENTAFELNTLGKQKNEKYSIRTVFSLKYEKNIESAELIINFHRSLIDLITTKYCS